MYRILLITDDWERKKALKSELAGRAFTITPLASSQVFEETFAPDRVDVIVADLERSTTDAAKLCHALRRDASLKAIPLILFVPEDRVDQLDFGWGFDEYLTLPVSGKRLNERVKFLMWRLNRVQLKDGFSRDGLVVDFERYEVHVQGAPVDLTYKEFELLKFLATHPGQVFTREALLNKVWGYDYYGGTRTVDVHIRRLRAKIERETAFIDTVRNVGYKFISS